MLALYSTHPNVERAELNARATADQQHFHLVINRTPRTLEDRIAAVLDELDGLEDAADESRRFELRAIAGRAYENLDGYRSERLLEGVA